MSAENDQAPDDNEDMLLALADQIPAVTNVMDGDGMNNKNVEERFEQQIISDDDATLAAAEYTEQREVRRIPSDFVSTVVEVPQPMSSQPQPTYTPPQPMSSPPTQTVTAPAPNPPAQPAKATTPTPNPPTQPAKAITPTPNPPTQPAKAIVSENIPPKEQPAPVKIESDTPVQNTVPNTEIKKDTTPVPTEKNVAEPKVEPAKPVAEPKAEPAKSVAEPKTEPVKPKEEIPVHGPVFKVQIAAASQLIPTTSSVFQGVENIESYQENGMVKYTVGASPDFEEISNLRKELLTKFPQAFIIAFKDGEKTDLAKAIREYKTIKNKRN